MAQKVYEDLEFIPPSEILGESDATVIKVYLPGFKLRDLKVTHLQESEPQKIRITGERPREGNKWIRFTKEIPIPPDCDTTGKIKARFAGGILSITLPKKTAGVKKADEMKEPKESGQEQQPKGQTETTNNAQASTKVVAPPEHNPDHDQKQTNGSVQDTKNKKTEEPVAPQAKGKAGISEEVPKPEESKGQTNNTSQASAKVVAHPETREEESSEAVRGGGSASEPPPPQPRESNKKAEERESGEPANPQGNGEAVSEDVPKPEEPKSQAQQAKQLNEEKDAKSETTTDDNKKEEGDTQNTVKKTSYECTFAKMRLKKRVKKLNLVLLVLAGIGIGMYVKNMIRSYGGEAD